MQIETAVNQFLSSMDRIANALEAMANISNEMAVGMSLTGSAPVATAPVEKELTRDEIKAELDSMRVEYSNKMRTNNLLTLLNEKKSEAVFCSDSSTECTDVPEPATPDAIEKPIAEGTVTFDEAVKMLRAYSAEVGLEKAKALLTSFGVDMLSALSPKQRVELKEQIERGLDDFRK